MSNNVSAGEETGGQKPKVSSSSSALQEGLHYVVENGLLVFTAHYLKERGYCCKNGCRHCPYGYRK